MIIQLEQQIIANGFNCLAMPVNMGDWGTGKTYSPRNALWQALHWNPRGLAIEPVAGLSMVMATRILTDYGHPWKWFPGAQYNSGADGRWSRSLDLDCGGSRFEFNAYGSDYFDGCDGSPVAFPSAVL